MIRPTFMSCPSARAATLRTLSEARISSASERRVLLHGKLQVAYPPPNNQIHDDEAAAKPVRRRRCPATVSLAPTRGARSTAPHPVASLRGRGPSAPTLTPLSPNRGISLQNRCPPHLIRRPEHPFPQGRGPEVARPLRVLLARRPGFQRQGVQRAQRPLPGGSGGCPPGLLLSSLERRSSLTGCAAPLIQDAMRDGLSPCTAPELPFPSGKRPRDPTNSRPQLEHPQCKAGSAESAAPSAGGLRGVSPRPLYSLV